MKLIIANKTSQPVLFTYRLPGRSHVRVRSIPIGRRVAVADDLARAEVEAILGQHAPFGLIAADDAERVPGFSGLCYALEH